ncbi:amidohydrolase family protein [Nocardia xishanensis]|uniref:Amidohydrolase family protein n=1 Tax=Nocardia xishanensis TaxID=238964 RepID=A0ABW7XCG3_9NOCA
MYDIVIKGGTVVDGTKRAPFVADVAIADGRVVRIGEVATEDAKRVIDAEGRYVTPGFVDIHTHYDAQVLWDPTIDTSSMHGYTTVLAGNCGLSLAPVTPASAEYMTGVLAKVEGIPLETLRQAVPFDWESFGSLLDRLDGNVAINFGVLTGHSALRSYVMGDRAASEAATDDDIQRMKEVLAQTIREGSLGFSSSHAESHVTQENQPVASRHSTMDELVALSRVCRDFEGTKLEHTPTVKNFTEATFKEMADMSVAAQRPLDFALLMDGVLSDDQVENLLSAADHARARGGEVRPQVVAQASQVFATLKTGFPYGIYPKPWSSIYALPRSERAAQFADPANYDALEAAAAQVRAGGDQLATTARFEEYTVESVSHPDNAQYVGRKIGDIAQELGWQPLKALLTIAVRDDLGTVFQQGILGRDDAEGWKRRARIASDNRGVLGATDGGAHLDVIDQYAQSTRFLIGAVREHKVLPIEEAIYLLAGEPAAFNGIKDRGVIREGAYGDVLVINLGELACKPTEMRSDLPAGGARLCTDAVGYEQIIVNGEIVYDHGQYTGALPGTVLRSGRDTYTVAGPQVATA